MAYLAWRTYVPLATAAAVTVVIAAGFLVDRPGIDPSLACSTAPWARVTVWVLAATGFFFIRNKLAVRREEWIRTAQVDLSAG